VSGRLLTSVRLTIRQEAFLLGLLFAHLCNPRNNVMRVAMIGGLYHGCLQKNVP
jgi:hypothetical protein